MRAKRFIEAVKQLKFPEVLDDEDYGRVVDLYRDAVEHSEDHVLVGFRVRGPVVRIVWVAIEVIGDVADKDLPPDIPPSEAGYLELRFSGLWFSEGATAELAELDDAKPDDMKDSRALLFSYPGRVSWEKLQRISEQSLAG